MSLLPVYDPKSFESIDLRKYHIRTIKDIIKFNEFVVSRMEEAEFILKKFNNQYATFQTVSAQLEAKMRKQQMSYGAGTPVNTEEVKAEIQTVEEKSSNEEHEALLDEIRSAVAEETLVEQLQETDSDEPLQTILGNYKMVYGKKGPMFYRLNAVGKMQLVSKKDVPEDIKTTMLAAIGKEA